MKETGREQDVKMREKKLEIRDRGEKKGLKIRFRILKRSMDPLVPNLYLLSG